MIEQLAQLVNSLVARVRRLETREVPSQAQLDGRYAQLAAENTFTENQRVDGTLIAGDFAGGDYTEIEADGTLEFNGDATVYDDINIGGLILDGPAATRPGLVTFLDNTGADTGISTRAYAVGEFASADVELLHGYEAGSPIGFHVHWQGDAAPTGTDKVRWQITYVITHTGQTTPPATTITVETDFDTQYENMLSEFADVTPPVGTAFGAQVSFRLDRIAATADEYAGEAKIKTVGIHYERARVGSRTVGTE